jgi:hypothetical protein
MAEKLNPKRPFAKLVGDKEAAFIQDGKRFDKQGKLVGDAPAAFCRDLNKKAAAAASTEESKSEVLERAESVLGNLDETQSVPQTVVDAEKENAQAEAAEELAD